MADIITTGISHALDLRSAVIFDGFVIAEDCYSRLWRWQKDCWRPLAAGYQQPSYRTRSLKQSLQNARPQQQRTNEKRDRRERSSLSGDMAKHGADSRLSPQAAGKSFPSR